MSPLSWAFFSKKSCRLFVPSVFNGPRMCGVPRLRRVWCANLHIPAQICTAFGTWNLCSTSSTSIFTFVHLSMLSPRGGGGTRAYVGHLTFQKNFWSKSPLWDLKTWSNQIKYPQVFDQFILKMSSKKWCFCTNIKTSFYLYLKQPSFRALLKPWKPRYFNFKMVGAAVVCFVSGLCQFRDTFFSARENRKLCK